MSRIIYIVEQHSSDVDGSNECQWIDVAFSTRRAAEEYVRGQPNKWVDPETGKVDDRWYWVDTVVLEDE